MSRAAFPAGPVPERDQVRAQLLLWARLSRLRREGGRSRVALDRTPRASVLTLSCRDASGACCGPVELVGELWATP